MSTDSRGLRVAAEGIFALLLFTLPTQMFGFSTSPSHLEKNSKSTEFWLARMFVKALSLQLGTAFHQKDFAKWGTIPTGTWRNPNSFSLCSCCFNCSWEAAETNSSRVSWSHPKYSKPQFETALSERQSLKHFHSISMCWQWISTLGGHGLETKKSERINMSRWYPKSSCVLTQIEQNLFKQNRDKEQTNWFWMRNKRQS